MTRVLTVVGARPQFIKAAAVSRVIQEASGVTEMLVHTGQHFDSNMSEIFFEELNIPAPKINLALGGGTHGAATGRMLEALEGVMMREKPDIVMVYGDTNSTLSGALAAAKLHIPIAHVEAGLRSFNRKMPEEVNRVLTDHLSRWLFCPTQTSVEHLSSEGIRDGVELVGDVMFDAVRFFRANAGRFKSSLGVVEPYIACTIHRAENVDDSERLGALVSTLGRAKRRIVLPLHPRTRKRMQEFGLRFPSNFTILEPLGYHEMLGLVAESELVVTDSGGCRKRRTFLASHALSRDRKLNGQN